MNSPLLKASLVNGYLAHKQHLLPASRLADVVQVTRDIVALHATGPTGPFLSLWARVPDFSRQTLEDALYERREPLLFQAYAERRIPGALRDQESLLVQAGICQEREAGALLKKLHRRVLAVLAEKGPSTVRQISQAVPEIMAKVRYDAGRLYAGEFSVGSRLVPGMCTLGLLIRARPRGTWRSNLYEYTTFSRWLPDVDLESATPQKARAWLGRRYLAAFGPATLDDVQWWTGFAKGETEEALRALRPAVVEVAIKGWGDGYLMLADDAQRLRDFAPPDVPYAFFLPGLDPYIMGYHDRRRFLAPEHRAKVFDRAGNALPTVWANGRVVGAWRQRKDGSVTYGLFEPVDEEELALLAGEAQRLEDLLEGDPVRPFSYTPFTRALEK